MPSLPNPGPARPDPEITAMPDSHPPHPAGTWGEVAGKLNPASQTTASTLKRRPAAKAIELQASATVTSSPPDHAPAGAPAPPGSLLHRLGQALAWLYHRLSFLHNLGLFGLFTTFGARTNHIMLAYRTVAQDLGDSPCNQDNLAADLRDKLMPVRGWVHRRAPLLLHAYRWFLQSSAFGCPGIIDFVDVRTRWFDEKVQAALSGGEIKQVVVVAGGYDTRAYRMGADSSVRFFEIDLPEASDSKRKLVRTLGFDQGGKLPVYIGADLSLVPLDRALEGSGFDPSAKTLFTCEGLLYYLPPDAVTALLRSISELSAPGSFLVFDFLDQAVHAQQKLAMGYHALRLTVQNKGEVLRSGLSPEPRELSRTLGGTGLAVQELLRPRDMAARMLPGRGAWSDLAPVLPPYFHYCVAEKKY